MDEEDDLDFDSTDRACSCQLVELQMLQSLVLCIGLYLLQFRLTKLIQISTLMRQRLTIITLPLQKQKER